MKHASIAWMLKSKAIALLGGSPTDAAAAIGCTASAVSQWPEHLPRRIEDRVIAALARQHLPPGMIGLDPQPEQAAAADVLPP